MNETTQRLAEMIKMYRKLQKMSQDDLSKSSGINVSTIKKYETGIRTPKHDQLCKIATALGINVNDFYDNNIHTTGELLSALISIEKQTDMKISADKDEDGNYRPETVRIEFDNKDVNKLLSQYLTYKNRNDSEDSFELERLILTDTPL